MNEKKHRQGLLKVIVGPLGQSIRMGVQVGIDGCASTLESAESELSGRCRGADKFQLLFDQKSRGFRSLIALGVLCGGWVMEFGLKTSLNAAEEKDNTLPMLKLVPAVQAAPNAAVGPVVPLNQDRGDWFESWVFGGLSAANARKRLENLGDQRLVVLKQQCGLSEDQIKKLELAKRGDIARFFRQVEAVRQKIGDKPPDRANMVDLKAAIAPLQRIWNTGLVGSDSLFVSVLRTLLSDDQKELLRREEARRSEEKNRFHAMSLIKMIEHSIPLTDKQRTKLLELVMEETTKIRGDSHLQQYVSIQAATKLSEETLASVLDASQLATFRQLQKHWETNLPFLNQMIKQPANEAGEEWLNVLR